MSRRLFFRSPVDGRSRAVIVSRQPPPAGSAVAPSTAELENLLSSLGVRVVGTLVQRRREPGALLGSGKLAELQDLLRSLQRIHGEEAIFVAFDEELRPGQQRELEKAVEVPVIDRTGVVLRIFEQRARTPIACLEVEIARLTYEAPRVRDQPGIGDREGGGGRGGRGHSNVELEKQRIRERIAQLRRKLEQLAAAEEQSRTSRDGVLQAALVGYTNAGKSSLMRALTGSEVLVEDRLFATLGATVRPLAPPSAPPVLVSDTVGFIRNLPHELVASFHSTLVEAREADLLLHVVDASDPEWRTQMRVTREGLAAVGADRVQELVVLNKIDRIGERDRAALAEELPEAIQVSALDERSVRKLRAAILATFEPLLEEARIEVPWADGRTLAAIRERARIVVEEQAEEGWRLLVRGLPADLERWKRSGRSPSPAA